jgi:pyruvate kinase
LVRQFRSTKIVATLGPATDDPEVLEEIVQAGVNVVRLNFSHGNLEDKARQISQVRDIEAVLGKPLAILQDLQGPKIRVGPIPLGPLKLAPGQEINIYSDRREGTSLGISTTYPLLPQEVEAGDSIFLDDGAIELRVREVEPGVVRCQVVIGGDLYGSKGVNLPGARISLPAVTEKDIADLRFGLQHGVDYVAMSFVRHPQDAVAARELMREEGISVPLLAKVEKREAVQRIGAVLRAFDGVMVARGDLGVELGPEKVPGAQKQIIARAISLGRPVITATQMLESMTHNHRPTRAEASDVANAVWDGSHAVMLSGETAVGRNPGEVVRAMDRIVREAELIEPQVARPRPLTRSATQAFCSAAVHLSGELEAQALAAFTRSGQTAETLSSLHPQQPILALCEDLGMTRRLCLWRGVVPLLIGDEVLGENASQRILRELNAGGVLPKGSRVVALGASPDSRPGLTNFIRLLRL